MKIRRIQWLVPAAVAVAVTPAALSAHGGHAGDHGFLSGALQPLLALDHLAAALVVVAVGAVAFGIVGWLRGHARRAAGRRPA